jgi:hypothetical protein
MSKKTGFEAWRVPCDWKAVDHTYIRCPDKHKTFKCWGSDTKKDSSRVLKGKGVYKVADCYRLPAFGHEDTAGIGVYGVNGVCHQTANLFLHTVGKTMAKGVHGYAWSVALWGFHGAYFPADSPLLNWIFYLDWKGAIYKPCYKKYKASEAEMLEETAPDDPEGRLFSSLMAYYDTLDLATPGDPNDIVAAEFALLVAHRLPELAASSFEEIHREMLVEKARILREKPRGEDLAAKINAISSRFQEQMHERIGAESHALLGGIDDPSPLAVVDPEIAEEVARHQ